MCQVSLVIKYRCPFCGLNLYLFYVCEPFLIAYVISIIVIYLHFQGRPLMILYNFATVHGLMNGTNLIDSCQTHLPVHIASNIEFIPRCDTGVVIDSVHT